LVNEAGKKLKNNIPMNGISGRKRSKLPRRVLEEPINNEYASNNYWKAVITYDIESLEQDYE
jgi:hypothetical protein